jgi:hypothetical protein
MMKLSCTSKALPSSFTASVDMAGMHKRVVTALLQVLLIGTSAASVVVAFSPPLSIPNSCCVRHSHRQRHGHRHRHRHQFNKQFNKQHRQHDCNKRTKMSLFPIEAVDEVTTFATTTLPTLPIASVSASVSSATSSSSFEIASLLSKASTLTQSDAEQIAGPFFGLSLFPYLAFLYYLNVPQNNTPKGITIGFATCLLFVFLTIPAAIGAQVLYGVSLADCDWLHGSAESLLTVTNLVTVVAFRQAFRGAALVAVETGTSTSSEQLSM